MQSICNGSFSRITACSNASCMFAYHSDFRSFQTSTVHDYMSLATCSAKCPRMKAIILSLRSFATQRFHLFERSPIFKLKRRETKPKVLRWLKPLKNSQVIMYYWLMQQFGVFLALTEQTKQNLSECHMTDDVR